MLNIKGIEYEHIKNLGDGAQGQVTLIKQINTQQEYALKIYSETVPEKSIEREIEILTQKFHPNILKVIDFGKIENNFYTITTYAPGGSLDMYIDNGELTLHQRVLVLRDALKGLQFLHNENIIHRDIKPANIFIDSKESFKGFLGDFGLAKERDDTMMDYSIMGGMMGTVAFLPPEYLKNETRTFDAKFDLYAIGVSLYKCITGYYPYGENEHELLENLNNPHFSPPLVRRYLPKTPKSLQDICIRALNSEKEERFKTAGQFIMNLESVLEESDLHYSCPKPGEIKLNKVEKKEIKKKVNKRTSQLPKRSRREKVTQDKSPANYKMQAIIGIAALTVSFAGYGIYAASNKAKPNSRKKVIRLPDQYNKEKENKPTSNITSLNKETKTNETEKTNSIKDTKTRFETEWASYPNFHNLDIFEIHRKMSELVRNNDKTLPKDYIEAMYQHVFKLFKQEYHISGQNTFVFDKAIQLKSMYSEFTEKDRDHYYYISQTKHISGGVAHIAQYAFLNNLTSTTSETRLLKKISKEISLYNRAQNAYFFINNVLSLFKDNPSAENYNIFEELKGDVYQIAGQRYLLTVLMNNADLFKKYYRKLSNKKNVYLRPYRLNEAENHHAAGYIRPVIDEYINLLSPKVQNQKFKYEIDKLNQANIEVIKEFMTTLNFDNIELHFRKYQELANIEGNNEITQLYGELNSRIFKLDVIKTLFSKADHHYQNVTHPGFQRLHNKKVSNINMMLLCSPKEHANKFLNNISQYYSSISNNSAIGQKLEGRFLHSYGQLRIKDEKVPNELRVLVEKELKKQLTSNEFRHDALNILKSWLTIQTYKENYTYIKKLYEYNKAEILPADEYSKESHLRIFKLVLNAYLLNIYDRKGSSKAIEFIESNQLLPLLKKDYEYSIHDVLEVLDQCSYAYSIGKKKEHIDKLESIVDTAIVNFKKHTISENNQALSERNGLFMMSIMRAYARTSYHNNELKRVREKIIDYQQVHEKLFSYHPRDTLKLYEDYLALHLLYHRSFKGKLKSYPKYLLKEYKQLENDRIFQKLLLVDRSLKTSHTQIQLKYGVLQKYFDKQ